MAEGFRTLRKNGRCGNENYLLSEHRKFQSRKISITYNDFFFILLS